MQNLSERQIQSLVEAILGSDSAGFFLVFSGDGRILMARGQLFETANQRTEDLIGAPLDKAFPSGSDDHPLLAAFDQAMKGAALSCRQAVGNFDAAWQLHPIRMDSERCVLALAVPVGEGPDMELGNSESEAQRDVQTGLWSRRALSRYAEQVIEQGTGAEWSLLRIRLDGLRPINRSYGQDIGDSVLRQAVNRLRAPLKQGDRLARASGNEFLAMVRTDGPRAVRELVENIDSLFEEPFEADDHQFILQLQVGIALYPRDARSAGELGRRATVAMERARHADIPHAFFDESWEQSVAIAGWLPAALRTALQRNEFELHYQPLVDSQTGDCRWLETLIRWRHPERGMISPGHFIPLAEEMRLMRKLDLWVLEHACRDARSLGKPVAVNLSPATLMAPDFLSALDRRIEASGIPADWLTLEITERTFADPHTTLPLLEAVRERDVLIAVDDFGVGYSSLAYLWQYPVDEVKLDGAFIRAVTGEQANDRAGDVIRGMVHMAQELNIKLVAEGVETPEQADWLREAGVAFQQGFHHCRPGPVSAMREWLDARDLSQAETTDR